MRKLLEIKNAVIYEAGGSIGGVVAGEFARDGARVFLASRTREKREGQSPGRPGSPKRSRRRRSPRWTARSVMRRPSGA